jgi:hypothetical protein
MPNFRKIRFTRTALAAKPRAAPMDFQIPLHIIAQFSGIKPCRLNLRLLYVFKARDKLVELPAVFCYIKQAGSSCLTWRLP